jgi:uncharacterized protein with HEPN domain
MTSGVRRKTLTATPYSSTTIIHDYMGVDLEAVWQITEQHLPAFKRQIELLLSEELE